MGNPTTCWKYQNLSADPQNGGTHDIFSAGGDNSQVSVIHGGGSNA